MKLARLRTPIIIYAAALCAYLGASGSRLARHTSDNHYVYLAQSFLKGRLDMLTAPPHRNDWARVEELTLKDGRQLRGATLKVGGGHRFRTTKGAIVTVEPGSVARRSYRHYVSFPPFPAVLMIPFVAFFGLAFNDVIFTVILAAAVPAFMYVLLRRLREEGISNRSRTDDLWLTALLGVGTVFYYSAVIGQVWYTAHVVAVLLVIGYAWCALGARSPLLAGVFLGLGFLTRDGPCLLMFPFFLFELVRTARREDATGERWRDRIDWRRVIRGCLLFGAPVMVVGIIAAGLNYARFDSLTEFGHTYLNVRWTARIQRWGLFNYHFVPRNLAAWFVLTPKILAKWPYVQVSWHGMSLFLTTPAFILLVWPKLRGHLHWPLWLTILPMFLLQVLYQNDGWVQFGYRFSLDYVVFLMMLLAVGGRPLRWPARTLILLGVAVNLFGALSFGRWQHFYYNGFFPAE